MVTLSQWLRGTIISVAKKNCPREEGGGKVCVFGLATQHTKKAVSDSLGLEASSQSKYSKDGYTVPTAPRDNNIGCQKNVHLFHRDGDGSVRVRMVR